MRLFNIATEVFKEAGVGFTEIVDSVASCEEASAFDVVVETDMTYVVTIKTDCTDVLSEIWMWHDAGEGVGTVVADREWSWTTSTCCSSWGDG